MEIIKNMYNVRLKKYGDHPNSLGWFGGRQQLRFKILTEIGSLDNSSILDVGCGFGDLYALLKAKNLNNNYVGIDINSQLIEIAKNKYPLATFMVKDIIKINFDRTFDWVFASGLFEFKMLGDYIPHILEKLFRCCNKGLAVNFLSDYVDFKNKNAYHAKPEEIFKFCKSLSKRVVLRHDYMPYEFCVYIYKQDCINKRNVFSEIDCIQKS